MARQIFVTMADIKQMMAVQLNGVNCFVLVSSPDLQGVIKSS
jgi:hypothetical protein